MKLIVRNNKYILLILILLFICTACGYKEDDNSLNVPSTPSKEEIINNVLLYDSSFDSEFLSYIYD